VHLDIFPSFFWLFRGREGVGGWCFFFPFIENVEGGGGKGLI
jgi:hypothetical protein